MNKKYKLILFGDKKTISIETDKKPHIIARLFFKIFLGFKIEKLD
jgi:hypothetical protein